MELAPIMEEDEHQLEEESHMPPPPFIQQQETPVVEEVENEERAIVLFNPSNNIIHHSPSTFSLTPHILSRLKGNFSFLFTYAPFLIVIIVILVNLSYCDFTIQATEISGLNTRIY